MLQLLPFSYTRHSLSFHLCNTLSLLGTAAAPSKSALALHMYFNFLFLFHFAHCATQHSATQHNRAQLFSTLFPLQALCMCVCVYAILLACVCVCRSFTTAIWLCFMLSFFCCLRFAHEYTQTRKHTLLALARAHTHGNSSSSSTQARNVMRRLKILFSSATTLGELQRSATGKWQLSASEVELRLR